MIFSLGQIRDLMTIKNVLDILIVAFIFYRLLFIMRGTHALQVTLGLLGMGVLYGVSLIYDLRALHWILGHLFDSFFILLVILFQDNIRTALASVGRSTRLFWKAAPSGELDTVDEVVEAAKMLSRQKIGALIVFERENSLESFIDTGSNLKCQIQSDLIYSIFQSNSPLHDGALIISKGVIQSAACFLPLSRNTNLDRHWGSRHRAALGISEMTDAVAVVVSEETRKMSICVQGKIYPIENAQWLRERLGFFLLDTDLGLRPA